ncbi:MAG: PEP-CTERM sorting domain-containing protein [Armatimonadetes bacterium]|nr:PEP-CTERM sorting domain-containing protein [Armatimonadota bacterium]
MRFFWALALCAAAMCSQSARIDAAAIILNFDDLSVGEPVPDGYMGITFDLGQMGFEGRTGRAIVADESTGARPGTPPNCIINEWGVRQLDFTASSGRFNFYGAVVASYGKVASLQAPMIGFVGFRDGKTEYLSPGFIITDKPGIASVSFLDVDMVEIVAANGATGDCGWYSLDHLMYEPVPEPSSLMVLGAPLMILLVRKRT